MGGEWWVVTEGRGVVGVREGRGVVHVREGRANELKANMQQTTATTTTKHNN